MVWGPSLFRCYDFPRASHSRQALTRSTAPSVSDTYHFSDMVHSIDECIVYKQILHLQCMMPFVISINVIKHVLVNLISIAVQLIFLPPFQAVHHPYTLSVLISAILGGKIWTIHAAYNDVEIHRFYLLI